MVRFKLKGECSTTWNEVVSLAEDVEEPQSFFDQDSVGQTAIQPAEKCQQLLHTDPDPDATGAGNVYPMNHYTTG